MSIQVSCQCGKKFMTGDQYAGKRTKCPACGQALTIPAAVAVAKPVVAKPAAAKPAAPVKAAAKAAPIVRPRPQTQPADDLMSLAETEEVFQPSSHPTTAAVEPAKTKKTAAAGVPPLSKRNRQSGPVVTPRISISPGFIVLIVLAILIPSAIYWAKEGPMKAQADWAKMADPASENICGQITRAMQLRYQDLGGGLTEMAFRPKAGNPVFDSLGMMIKMPDDIIFQGSTSDGHYTGVFHPKTWRFEADVPLRTSKKLLHITGSASESDQSLEIDGKARTDFPAPPAPEPR